MDRSRTLVSLCAVKILLARQAAFLIARVESNGEGMDNGPTLSIFIYFQWGGIKINYDFFNSQINSG